MLPAIAAVLLIKRARQTSQRPKPSPVSPKHTATRSVNANMNVTVLGMGGASLGDLYVKISNEQAMKALLAAHQHHINLFDTSPWYGVGLSEARFGIALHAVPRQSFLLQTKVGRYLVPDRRCQNGVPVGWRGGFPFGVRFDYSAAAFQRQMEDSLQRTGLGYIDSIVIHDLEPTPRLGTQEEKTEHALADVKVLASSGWGYLVAQRDRGHLKAFGAGLNSNEDGEDEALKRAWNKKYVRALVELHQTQGKIDFLLLANMWSLLNFEAYEDGILQVCEEHGIKIIVGGPYSSGILATGADPTNGSVPYYNYGHASDAVRARCRRIEKICQQFGVPLIAAALQFPLLCSSVVSVIPGGKNEWEVCSNVDNMNVQIPNELWHALKQHKLLPAGLVLPGEESC